MAARMASDHVIAGKRVLLSSTSQDQSDVFWEYITEWFAPLLKSKQAYKNEVKRILRYNGGRVQVKTGSNPDVLRSGYADLLVLDECAYLDPDAWRKVGIPMLADKNGSAVFISTPKRRNWFFELFVKAKSDTTGDWQAWNFSTRENPHLTEEAYQRLVENMTEEDFEQEILAKFLEGQGAVFRYIDDSATIPVIETSPYVLGIEPIAGHRYVFGVDWAMSKDFTVIMVIDVTTKELVAFDRFNKVDWALQRGRLTTLYNIYKPSTIWAENNSIGSPNIEALQREGLPVRRFETTAITKPPLIESLVLAFDRKEIKILNHPILKGELMAYERKVSSTTGRSQYNAPDGMHDDTVMGLALAWNAAISGILTMPYLLG